MFARTGNLDGNLADAGSPGDATRLERRAGLEPQESRDIGAERVDGIAAFHHDERRQAERRDAAASIA